MHLEEDPILSGDPKRLQQVFYNTLDNAIKYSLDGGRISVTLKEEADSIVFQVTNGGTVIDEEDIERIGERFFRTDKARNRTTGGTGLGLSIVKEIVRLHGGSLQIASSPDSGTTITIHLPGMNADEEGVK